MATRDESTALMALGAFTGVLVGGGIGGAIVGGAIGYILGMKSK